MDFKAILFDLDGTLTDPAEGITNSVAYALKKYGISVEDKTELNRFIGPPLIESFMEFYGFSKEKAIEAVSVYREYFSVIGIFENKIYDGVEELLKNLQQKGKKVILATSKPEKFARKILEYFKISQYFDFVAGASMDETRSKKQEVIAYALEKCKITCPEQAVMVGDRRFDIEGAKIFGLKTVGVLYGYGDLTEIEAQNPDYIVKTVAELKKIL